MCLPDNIDVFHIKSKQDFETKALKIFKFQAIHNAVYNKFIKLLNINPKTIDNIYKIPFLPISFFKDYRIVSEREPYDALFQSSGTTGINRSKHFVKNIKIYEQSFFNGFEYFYGKTEDYVILALLPSYLEQQASSLVYMVQELIKKSNRQESNFYLYEHQKLADTLHDLDQSGNKILLIGVSYALLDLIEKYKFKLNNVIVMETGGMKGRRKEILREELHQKLKKGFGVQHIHSEYGMTELLSQSYSKGNGIFESVPWKKILVRDPEDPMSYLPKGKTGGINIIDLANIYSCSFIATQDLGKIYSDNSFEILGRFDHSDIRGCNLLVVN